MAEAGHETDITALMLFTHKQEEFWVSPGTLLQCLHIAERENRVPALDPEWVERAIPLAYRAQPQPDDGAEERLKDQTSSRGADED